MRYTSTISSRYFESSTVCYVLILTYILSPVEHMHKIMNSDQTGKVTRKKGKEKNTFLNHHDITSWDLSLTHTKVPPLLIAASLELCGI